MDNTRIFQSEEVKEFFTDDNGREFIRVETDSSLLTPEISEEFNSNDTMAGTVPTRGDVLLSAHKTINGKRQDVYGNPEDSFQIIANLWDGYITTKMEKAKVQPVITSFIQSQDVMLMMALMKIARIQNNPKDKDSYRDALGYLALACDYMTAEDMEKD